MEIHVPKFGMSTVEVEVLEVFVAVGQTVAVGDPIVELETDKVTSTVESEVAGTVTEVLAEVGATLEVGDVLCRLD
jgi:pyruvate/2-oxoglutarate dehydrogenase complex dihydrolipoamide acyltransferase (E2) component